MADNSAIEWTDASWNPLRARNTVTGKVGWFCTHVSEGCRNCYAEGFNRRLGTGIDYKPQALKAGQVELFLDSAMLTQPLRWKKPRMIFVCSMTDLFADFVTDDQLDQIWAVIALACTRHTFQILTKRPERMRAYLSDPAWAGRIAEHMLRFPEAFGDYVPSTLVGPLPNVWLGVSVEDQARADERIPELMLTPAAVRWVSAEPLLGPVDLTRVRRFPTGVADAEFLDVMNGYCVTLLPTPRSDGRVWSHLKMHDGSDPDRFYNDPESLPRIGLDWVVAGGESGPGARPMHPDWARQLRDQCAAAGAPFLFKQWGAWTEFGHADDGPAVHEVDVGSDVADSYLSAVPANRRCFLSATGSAFHGHPDNLPEGQPHRMMERVGKKAAGRLLDGVLHDGFPEARP